MPLKLLIIIFVCVVSVCVCDHLILGDAVGRRILHHYVEEHCKITFIKREKSFFYSDPKLRIINAIIVYDNLHSKATATVTAGGIGFTYVNINMNSERGEGLVYDIGLYS